MADKRPTRKQPQRSAKKQKLDDKHSHEHLHAPGHEHHHKQGHHHGHDHEGHDHAMVGREAWNKYWSSDLSKDDHTDEAHECLLKYKDALLKGRSNVKVFLPLCGKSYDMKWLADLGHEVVGVEIVETAIKQFFKETKLKYTVHEVKEIKGKVYKSSENKIRIYVCDFFLFKPEVEKGFDAVWDSGAMHSLPKSQLKKYTDVIKPLMTSNCQYLLEFTVPGCFSEKVGKSDLKRFFGNSFKIDHLGLTKTSRKFYKNWGIDGFMVYHISKK